jgi:hypothetical protein
MVPMGQRDEFVVEGVFDSIGRATEGLRNLLQGPVAAPEGVELLKAVLHALERPVDFTPKERTLLIEDLVGLIKEHDPNF